MLKFAALLTLVSAVLCASALMAAPAGLHYVITPQAADGQMRHVRISFNMPTRAGETYTVDVPEDLSSGAAPTAFSIQGGERLDADARKLVIKAAASRVTVSYRLGVGTGADMRAANQQTMLRANGFSMRGEDVLLIPRGFEARSATVALGGVAGWTTASSLHGHTPVSQLGDSHFLGGAEFRVVSRKVDGAVFRLVYPQSFAARAERLLDQAATVMTTERRFWRTPAKPVFIGLVELRNESNYSGRGLQDGFMLYLGRDADRKSVLRLIAHENLHGWISRAIGGFPAVDSDLEAWLNEGFVEAYTARLLLQSGLWTMQDYIDDWNASLVRYGTSPVKAEPNSRILADRQRNFDVNKLPYDRGRLLAVKWDRAFRRQTAGRMGLDDVLRAQMQEAQRLERAGRVASADQLFPIIVKRVIGADIAADLARYVDQGEPIIVESDAFGPCVDVVNVDQPAFERGFDLDATFEAGRRVTGLVPGGPAESAGLRQGDKIRIDEIPTNDSRVTLSYRVDDGAGAGRIVQYRPEGKATVTFQQLALKAGQQCPAQPL